jgi:hypothetical protein
MGEREVTLLERAERDALEDLYRAAPPDHPVRAERLGGATVLLAPGLPPFFNRAFAFGLDEPVTEAGIDAILAALRPASAYYVQPPPGATEIEAWLAARRHSTSWAWAKVMRGTEPPPEIPTNLEIRELAEDEADRFGAVVCTAFGLPPGTAPWTASVVGRPGWRAYGAFDHDAIVAAGALYVEGDVGWLGMAGTLPFHRRRGAQGALMVRRIADAISLGCTTIATETGILADRPNPSLDNMLRCGFAIAYERPVWSK